MLLTGSKQPLVKAEEKVRYLFVECKLSEVRKDCWYLNTGIKMSPRKHRRATDVSVTIMYLAFIDRLALGNR